MQKHAQKPPSKICSVSRALADMTPEEKSQIAKAMKATREKARGYADFFGWATDRDLEEWGVLKSLFESMEMNKSLPYKDLRMRGRGNDPPDCEAVDARSRRVAIEVTELVEGEAIKRAKAGAQYDWEEWNCEKFLNRLQGLLVQKDSKFPKLKDPPYEGGYSVVVFTDEPELPANKVKEYLEGHTFAGLENISETIFLVSYDPQENCCPYFPLQICS